MSLPTEPGDFTTHARASVLGMTGDRGALVLVEEEPSPWANARSMHTPRDECFG